MTADEKRVKARLEQIKARASEMNANAKKKDDLKASDLAEEAASLGLQLLEGK